jgi:hypothetical protein
MAEKCGECGYDIAACNEIALLRASLLRHATRSRHRAAYGGGTVHVGFACLICDAECEPADYANQRWHAAGCILSPRACDMEAATQVARAFEDRRVFGVGHLVVDATTPGGLRRVDPAHVTISPPTTVEKGKL